ncbi:MAG: HAD-IA family hydrolase [Syntrophaceae bacterium]|nr:HAD-IA family hydrolase [Syntrophaceae bacterium]
MSKPDGRMFVQLMVFDLDGTLADTGADLAGSVNRTLRSMGIPGRPEPEILRFVGDGVRKLLERSLGEAHRGRLDEALTRFKSDYAEHLLDRTVLYPGVLDLLRRFSDKAKVIITNKNTDFSLALCRGLGIESCFREIIGGDSAAFMKPDPRVLLPLLDRYGSKPEETLVVGDGVNDILLARNAGVRSCAILNGIGSREELIGLKPDFAIERITDLERIAC